MRGRTVLRHISLEDRDRYVDASMLFRREEKEKLFTADAFELLAGSDESPEVAEYRRPQNGSWLSALQYLDLKTYLPLDILTKVDRMSMAHSIETRVPLLDHKLVEFAATIPPELKLRNGTTKYILKRALRDILPDAVIDRAKQGFAIPLGRWFRGQLREYVRELLLSETSRSRRIFRPGYIEELARRPEKGRETDLDLELWTLISFELWCRTFLDGSQTPRPVVRTEGRQDHRISAWSRKHSRSADGRRER